MKLSKGWGASRIARRHRPPGGIARELGVCCCRSERTKSGLGKVDIGLWISWGIWGKLCPTYPQSCPQTYPQAQQVVRAEAPPPTGKNVLRLLDKKKRN